MLHEWRSSTTQWFKIIFKGAFLYSYDEDWLLPNEYKRSTLSHDKIDSRSILLIPGLHDLSSTFSCFMFHDTEMDKSIQGFLAQKWPRLLHVHSVLN
jgi:hypothetical protein